MKENITIDNLQDKQNSQKISKSISTEEAHVLLSKYNYTRHILDHSLESAVIMKSLAKHFGEDEGYDLIDIIVPILAHTECLECMEGKYQRKEKVDS